MSNPAVGRDRDPRRGPLLLVAILWIVPIVLNITLQTFLVISGAAPSRSRITSAASSWAWRHWSVHPYRPGDGVTIGGSSGEVRTKGLRALHILALDTDMIAILHSKMWTDNNISDPGDGARTPMCVANF